MKVAIPCESLDGERRVALVPDGVSKLQAAGFDRVSVQAGAGSGAFIPDQAYADAGAEVEADLDRLLDGADAVLRVQPPSEAEAGRLPEGCVLVSFLQPAAVPATIRVLAQRRVTAFSLELVPRISRAQAMDALSSQAGVAGYKAVLIGAGLAPKFFPMLMTAAGTIAPARVLVMGAGVAGLQAIATARRLGAVVSAYDVRAAVRDEVRSLGATFVELELEAREGEGGYAAEQSEEFLRRQQELIGKHVAASDVVITTAAIPGRRAPVLLTEAMVRSMRPGSVVVDLAAESGGNVELSRPGEDVVVEGVTIHGARNVPSSMPVHASQLYSRNVTTLLISLVHEGAIRIDMDDEVVKGACVTRDGEVVNARAREALATAT